MPTLGFCPPPPPSVPSLRLATAVNFKSKTLRYREVFKGTERDVDYDCLVIATGAQNNTFGVPGVNEVNIYIKMTISLVFLRESLATKGERTLA